MGKRILQAALLFGLLACLAGRASAWNGHGHMVVAKIAYDGLSDAEKLKVGKLLEAHPHFDSYLSKQKPSGVSAGEWAFLRAATWPDYVKSKNPRAEGAKYSLPTIHFVDKPFVDPDEADQFDAAALQPKGETVLTGLPKFTAQLKGGETDADKAVALCWVLHLVGDIHQPLHCASYYSSRFPHGDRGGNSQLVTVQGRTLPLHVYWDGLIGSSVKYGVVKADALEIARDPAASAPEFKERAARTKAAEWADESFKLAATVAYLEGALKSRAIGGHADEDDEPNIEAPESYAPRARACARSQVALAGLRLAAALKTSLPE